jgi:hypothetical protein
MHITSEESFVSEMKKFRDKWDSLHFVYTQSNNLKHRKRLVLEFKGKDSFKRFLDREQALAVKSQEFANASHVRDIIVGEDEPKNTDFFYLHYTIQSDESSIKVLFKTNSLVFRYGVIG